MLIYVYIFIML